MNIVMTLLTRDEADILRANIEYHLERGVCSFIVTDNLSRDGTRDILLEFERQKLVHYIAERDDDYAQRVWVTRMARLAHEQFRADWIINSDADEFWWPVSDSLLSAVFSRVPQKVFALRVQRTNFVPTDFDPTSAFYDRMTLRDTRSSNSTGAPLPPKVCHRASGDVVVEQGNHGVTCSHAIVTEATSAMTIFHFPLRSYAQFENKIVQGARAVMRNPNLGYTNITWKYLYQVWLRGGLRDWYESEMVTAKTMEWNFESGRYVLDERLRDYLRKLLPEQQSNLTPPSGGQPPASPAAAAHVKR